MQNKKVEECQEGHSVDDCVGDEHTGHSAYVLENELDDWRVYVSHVVV